MDALQVHAAAAAAAAASAGQGGVFNDVAVGFPAAKGRCVRIFYGGERTAERLPGDVLNAELIGQAIMVRGYWPLAETATKRQRLMEGEMAGFVKEFRTRVSADSQLGGESTDMTIRPAVAEQVIVAGNKYAVVDLELVVDYDEYPRAP